MQNRFAFVCMTGKFPICSRKCSCRYTVGCLTIERFETNSIVFFITSFSSQDLQVDVFVSILRRTNLRRAACFYFDHTQLYPDFLSFFFFPSNDPHPPSFGIDSNAPCRQAASCNAGFYREYFDCIAMWNSLLL